MQLFIDLIIVIAAIVSVIADTISILQFMMGACYNLLDQVSGWLVMEMLSVGSLCLTSYI